MQLSTRVIALAALSGAAIHCTPAPILPMSPPPSTDEPASTVSPNEPAPAVTHPDEAARRSLFADLVAKLKRLHVFAPAAFANLGRAWADDLPELEAEFAAADTPAKLRIALRHLGFSLRDLHCRYHAPERGGVMGVGFTVAAEWQGEQPSFYVASIDDAERVPGLAVGDVLTEVDGIASDQLMHVYRLETNGNSRPMLAVGLARYIARRNVEDRWAREGRASTFRFRRRGSGETLTVQPTWKRLGRGMSDRALDWDPGARYDRPSCARLRDTDYGPYELSHRGWGICVYTSKRRPFAAYPIVRQFTFSYSLPRAPFDPAYLLEKDQQVLRATLAPSKGVRGVVLDLRDNHGGNNPNWFLDWWAPGSYVDDLVHYRVHPQLLEQATGERGFLRHPELQADYRELLQEGGEGERYTRGWPFFCPSRGCDWDNRYTPDDQVTTAPLALLVGPGCVSSCDALARQFAANDFGVLVGEPTAAAHTTARIDLPVMVGDLDLGRLTIAVSYEVDGKTGERIEAVPIAIDRPVPKTFANRDRYDAEVVRAAIDALKR